MNGIVAPEIQRRSAGAFEELQPGDLAVAAVEDRVQEEEKRPGQLERRRRREKKRGPREAYYQAGESQGIRCHGGPDEAPRERQRDPPLDVTRHEAFRVLDETAQQPRLRRGEVARGPERKAALGVGGSLHDREPLPQGDQQFRGAGPARSVQHGLRIAGVHDRHLRGIHPERFGFERHRGQRFQPARLRDDVVRHENQPATARFRGVGGCETRARRRERDPSPEGQTRDHGLACDARRRIGAHDDEEAFRHSRDPTPGAGLKGMSTPPRRLDSRAMCSISQQSSASARLAAASPSPAMADTKRSATL